MQGDLCNADSEADFYFDIFIQERKVLKLVLNWQLLAILLITLALMWIKL